MKESKLFTDKLKVVNVGISSFEDGVKAHGGEVVSVDWNPPLSVDSDLRQIIYENLEKIDDANKEVSKVILSGKPTLIDMDRAINVIPGMRSNKILHAGPPVTWDRMCGPMRGGIIAALMYEGMAENPEDAEKLAASGDVEFAPCHEHSTVGPMAGIVSESMPVFVLKNEEYGNLAYCTMNEGLGKVLRYGAYGEDVIERLRWMEMVLYPNLKRAILDVGKIDLKNIIAQALHMGDEVHNRNRAATSLLYRTLAPSIIKTCKNTGDAKDVLDFINNNDHFFLNLSMPACKVTLDAARNIPFSSVAVAMCRNGTDFGVQLAGTGKDWFTGPAEVPDALYFPGYTKEDANPDIGDSSITETNGLGGFAIASAPAIVQFVGGSSSDALMYTKAMYEIAACENNIYQIPYLDFRGTPTGIDVVKVVEKNILPFIDTGVAHKDPGVGQVGAGVLSAPATPFIKAYEGLAERLRSK